MILAVLAQMPAVSLLPVGFKLVRPFADPHYWGTAETTAGVILSVLLLVLLFTLGFWWGKRSVSRANADADIG